MNQFKKIFIFLLFLLASGTAYAGQTDKINGWAWSSNIGWISFNCTNTNYCLTVDYGVDVDSSGNVTGYAWSSNVGWINFNGVSYNSTTRALSGVANFVTADTGTDGWDDGTLLLSDTTPIAYGPVLNTVTNVFQGFSWGSEVIGWVDFDTPFGSVKLDLFSFIFSANIGLSADDMVPYGRNVVFTWNTDAGVVSCIASNGAGTNWVTPSSKPVNSTGTTVSGLTTDTTFSLTCFNAGGKSITRTLSIFVQPPSPVITLTAADTNILLNSAADLTWTGQNVNNCVGNWPSAGTPKADSGTETTQPLTSLDNVFQLTCQSDYPSVYPGDYHQFVTVHAGKLIIDLQREVDRGEDPSYGRFGEAVTIIYKVQHPQSCTADGDFNTVNRFRATTTIENDAPFVPAFDTDNHNIKYTFKTEPLFNQADDSQRKDYSFILNCTGSSGQTASSTLNINFGRNPNYDEI